MIPAAMKISTGTKSDPYCDETAAPAAEEQMRAQTADIHRWRIRP
jgi:hypothetical protein